MDLYELRAQALHARWHEIRLEPPHDEDEVTLIKDWLETHLRGQHRVYLLSYFGTDNPKAAIGYVHRYFFENEIDATEFQVRFG